MCVISGPVHEVSNTKICVLPSLGQNGEEMQSVIYSCTLDSQTPNTMILAVWNPSGDASQITMHEVHSEFFHEIDSLFPRYQIPSGTKLGITRGPSKQIIQVQVGGFDVAIVPTINELQFAPFSGSVVGALIPTLRSQYPQNYSFILARFLPGKKDYHPLGYSHPRPPKMIVPTFHFHQDDRWWTLNYWNSDNTKGDFAHSLYLCGVGRHNEGIHSNWRSIFTSILKRTKPMIQFDTETVCFSWIEIKGTYNNVDITLPWNLKSMDHSIQQDLVEQLKN